MNSPSIASAVFSRRKEPGDRMTTRGNLILGFRLLILAAGLATVGGRPAGSGVALGQSHLTLQGTGATFPAPLYQRWFSEYNKLHPDVEINYQALGSGAGIKQFQQGL